MICDHLNVHIRKNRRYKEHMVFLDLICTSVPSNIACIGLFHHSNITFLILITIDVIESMKLIQAKKFIVFWPLGRIEASYNGKINEIYDTFSAMRLRVWVIKLHV